METLGASKQIEYILRLCIERHYLINQFKMLGPAKNQLLNLFSAIVMFRITYAAAAWRRFASPAEINYSQIFVNKAKIWCIVTDNIDIIDVWDVIDYNLFRKFQYRNHYSTPSSPYCSSNISLHGLMQ